MVWIDFESFYSENNCIHTHSQECFPWQANLVHCANGIYVPQGIGIPGILATYPWIETFLWALARRLQLLLDLPAIPGTMYMVFSMYVLNFERYVYNSPFF